MVIKCVCAWCGSFLGHKECQCSPHQPLEEPISHSICPGCFEKALAEIESITAVTNKPISK
jgi:predicted amidophosphoribosyltransferase